jgi:hypothetical protein
MFACNPGDYGYLTVESGNITPGGWHGTGATTQASFNMGSCRTKTAVISSNLWRDGYIGLGPTASIILPAAATSTTEVLTMGNNTDDTSYGNGQATVPENYTGVIDQGYLKVESGSKAQYADVLGIFQQHVVDKTSNSDFPYMAASNSGNVSASFLRTMLTQAFDPRQMTPSLLVAPITDPASSDIRIEHVWTAGSASKDVQFVIPNGKYQ